MPDLIGYTADADTCIPPGGKRFPINGAISLKLHVRPTLTDPPAPVPPVKVGVG